MHTINKSKVKNAIARVTAMALALLLLFGTVAGPVGNSAWSMATEPEGHEENIAGLTEEISQDPPPPQELHAPDPQPPHGQESHTDTGGNGSADGSNAGGQGAPADTGSFDHGGVV